ncbi:MAG: efflux RND transporter periplasmic adaptor subunit [Massilia sp.]|nr:efflux RND transporter periplasmic adaptor subunit [Massilia sp.]
MKSKTLFLTLLAAGLVTAVGYGIYSIGMSRGMTMAASAPAGVAGTDPSTGKKVLYWHDPMVPGQKFDKPGKSPFMDMQLVPVYAGDAGDDGKVSISARVQQNLGMRTAEVMKGPMSAPFDAVGSVAYNERDVALVQARSNGFVERLYVRAPFEAVRKGQPLAELYVPEWIAAQEEYLSIKRMAGAGAALLDAARQRMRLVGMSDEQIGLVESSDKIHPRLTIAAPIGGVIAELGAREGMTVTTGASLFRINGLGTVWVNAQVPENLAAMIKPGTTVNVHTQALPETVFKGKVSAILPEVNAATRTLTARVEVANPSGQLVPGMFTSIRFKAPAGKDVLSVPSEAVIQTGTRSVVMVLQGEGHFLPVEVDVGAEANGQSEIRKGLQAGQKVVLSGQFLIDSEASLKATGTRMSAMPATPAAKAPEVKAPEVKAPDGPVHRGEGTVEKIDKDDITLSHGPIPTLQWGAMTMAFKLPAGLLPATIAVGGKVAFGIRQTKDGAYEISAIAPASAVSKDGMPAMPMKTERAGGAK